jgi:hypothetical protein
MDYLQAEVVFEKEEIAKAAYNELRKVIDGMGKVSYSKVKTLNQWVYKVSVDCGQEKVARWAGGFLKGFQTAYRIRLAE